MKNIRNILILVAIGIGAVSCAEACVRLGGATTRADLERTLTR